MITIGKFALAALAAMFITLPAQAQVGPFQQSAMPSDVRVSVGVSIPLGGPRDRTDRAPRLELSMAPEYAVQENDGLPLLRPLEPAHQQRPSLPLVSFNLDDSRTLSFAGQPIYSSRLYADEGESEEGERRGRTTGQKILRGAAVAGAVVALGVGGLVIAYATTDNDE